MAGVAAYFVERNQAAIAIEQGVLQALRHDGAGQLLEAPAEAADIVLGGGFDPPQQDCCNEIVHAAVGEGAALLAAAIVSSISRTSSAAGSPSRMIAAIDRKSGDDLDERLAQGEGRIVACPAAGIGNRLDVGDENLEFAGEVVLDDLELGLFEKRHHRSRWRPDASR